MITDEAKQKYIASDGNICPYCGSDQVDSEPVHLEGDYFVAYVICLNLDCDKRWKDTYGLVDVEEVLDEV